MTSNRKESERYELLRDLYNELNHRSVLLDELERQHDIDQSVLAELRQEAQEAKRRLGDATSRARNARTSRQWRASKSALQDGLGALKAFLDFIEVKFGFDCTFEMLPINSAQRDALTCWIHEVAKSFELMKTARV